MTENQRDTYRVPFRVKAELFFEGAISPCTIINMSAGGMLVSTFMDPPEVGEQVTLGLRLFDELAAAAGLDYLNFQLELLEVQPDPADKASKRLRLKTLTTKGSTAYERAHKVVFEAERQRLGDKSGLGNAEPMASGPERREALNPPRTPRYSRGSVNGLLRD